jgi:ABC-2 type transport system permease protein
MMGTVQLVSILFGRLAGPIFDKELRVASRRGLTYLLRFVYIGLFSLFVISIWLPAIYVPRSPTSSALSASQMGAGAIYIVLSTVWFQFLASQILAVVLLSGAIGSEIRKGSLDALLVSPISSLQIVLGKLASGLLQVFLLLAISLPLLALVRVFGGVPWSGVVVSLCIAVTAAIVAGSLSLFLSDVGNWNAVIGRALSWLLLVWVIIPAVGWISHNSVGYFHSSMWLTALYLSNPVYVLVEQSRALLYPGLRLAFPLHYWPLHCLAMLAAAAIILLLSARRVRRVALAPVPGGNEAKRGAAGPTVWDRLSRRAVRRVTGSPIVWREMKRPILHRGRRGVVQAILMASVGCVVAGALGYLFIRMPESIGPACIAFAAGLQLAFSLFVALGSASAITREKEARTLPILLTIPYEGGNILKEKTIGILRRHLPLLLPVPLLGVLAYLLIPSADRNGLVAATAWFEANLVGNTVFLMGLGLCLSAYVRTTTLAAVLTFVLYVGARIGFSFFFLMLGFMGIGRATRGHEVLGLIVVMMIVQLVVYGGIGVILGNVAARALRPRCQG